MNETTSNIVAFIMAVALIAFFIGATTLDLQILWADETPLTLERAEELNQMCNNKCLEKGFEEGGNITRNWIPFGHYLKNECKCISICKSYPNSQGEREEYKCAISKNKIELFEEKEGN